MGDGKTYSRASGIGFNLNNNADFVEQIGYDGSTGITTVSRFDIKYNAQYYSASPFPNGYYNPIDTNYYPYPKEGVGTKYRNGAELNWDYTNRRSNIYTIASQWTKYGYYSALNVENNGLSGTYSDTLTKGRYAPMPNCYSTKPLSGDTQLITTITTTGVNSIKSALGPNVLPLDDDGPYGSSDYNYEKDWNLDTGYYPDGTIGKTGSNNGGLDFIFDNKNPDIGTWGGDGTTNSYFQINVGNGGNYKIKGRVDLAGKYDALPTYAKYHLEIVVYRNGQNIKILQEPRDVPTGGDDFAWVDWGIQWNLDNNYYFQENDLIYFNIHTERLNKRMSFRLQNVNVSVYKIPTGNIFPLIIGNMYLPTFEATKYDTVYYPVGPGKDIFDTNSGGFNAPKLTEMDLILYPITDEMFNIVEHTQINNPYENGTINYYFFCNQYWKLRDFIYNEIN
jgi:hypothetical protein